MLLSDIIKDVQLKNGRNSDNKVTFINVLMFYIQCVNAHNDKKVNQKYKIGVESDLKYKTASLYNQIKKEKFAFRSYLYWSKKSKVLQENLELFNEFVEKDLNKEDPNYIEVSQYVITK